MGCCIRGSYRAPLAVVLVRLHQSAGCNLYSACHLGRRTPPPPPPRDQPSQLQVANVHDLTPSTKSAPRLIPTPGVILWKSVARYSHHHICFFISCCLLSTYIEFYQAPLAHTPSSRRSVVWKSPAFLASNRLGNSKNQQ